jgi:hypothetical protein
VEEVYDNCPLFICHTGKGSIAMKDMACRDNIPGKNIIKVTKDEITVLAKVIYVCHYFVEESQNNGQEIFETLQSFKN